MRGGSVRIAAAPRWTDQRQRRLVTQPPATPEPLDVIARELYQQARQRSKWWPAWEDLDMTDPFEAGLIRMAYERAQDFVATNSQREE